jgi:homoprotocatechuate degradation regulator HpaR
MAMQDFSRSLPMMLYRTLDAVMPPFRRIFNEFGLTEQQWRVLRVLWEQGATTLRELSQLTLIAAPSLVGVVDRLEASGLVKRNRSLEDRRNVFVEATAAGRQLEASVRPRVAAAYGELRATVDARQWWQLINILESIAVPDADPPQGDTVTPAKNRLRSGQ